MRDHFTAGIPNKEHCLVELIAKIGGARFLVVVKECCPGEDVRSPLQC